MTYAQTHSEPPLPDPLVTAEQASVSGDIGKGDAEKPQKWSLPDWIKLTIRERVLTVILLICLVMIPATMPRASVEAYSFVPSDPGLQSVERAEENFSGSAFYFIDPAYATPQNYGQTNDGAITDPDSALPGQSANTQMFDPEGAALAYLIHPKPFRASAIDNSRAQQCMTSAIYYEAGMEPDAGQRAVAQVILNRVRHPSYPGTVCGVIFQGSERRTGCQFSYTCDGSLNRKPSSYHWKRAQKVAAEALAGRINSMVGTATHYHATYVYPYWAPSLKFLGTIGAHRFYSWKGSAGKANAFSQRYRGGEPLPAPKPRKYNIAANSTGSSTLDPIALERAYEAAKRKAEAAEAIQSEKAAALAADNARRHDRLAPALDIAAPRAYQVPNYSREAKAKGGEKAFAGQKLPDVSQIKPEFRNSGTWKAKPGS
jgi:spore germination cell wall hydrolase CwlJ-like protein